MLRIGCICLLLIVLANELAAQTTRTVSHCALSNDEAAEPAVQNHGPPKRTSFHIIWGCLTMTIICAWTGVHPNIPPREHLLKRTLRRLELMIWTIIAPEILPCWAYNQLLAAMTVRNVYNGQGARGGRVSEGIWKTMKRIIRDWVSWDEIPNDETRSAEWTLRHGYFLIMGGFHLVAEGASMTEVTTNATGMEKVIGDVATRSTPPPMTSHLDLEKGLHPQPQQVEILTLDLLKKLIKHPNFKIQITEEEIVDRSKGDALAKFIFIFQTSWFIFQCIARAIQGLYFTQLELTTLALASLNGVTLVLWWYKPLGAQTPVRVFLNSELLKESNSPTSSMPERRRRQSYRADLTCDIKNVFAPESTNWFIRHFLHIVFLALSPFIILILVCRATIMDLLRSPTLPAGATYVPTFYVPDHEYNQAEYSHFLILMILASLFGGIHCAGWNLPYPTLIEQKIWRGASLVLTISPICAIPIIAVIVYLFMDIFQRLVNKICRVIHVPAPTPAHGSTNLIPLEITAGICVAARLILLAQSLALLRDQPPSAYIAVDWTRFYPRFL